MVDFKQFTSKNASNNGKIAELTPSQGIHFLGSTFHFCEGQIFSCMLDDQIHIESCQPIKREEKEKKKKKRRKKRSRRRIHR
jgi:hypothetical protein